MSVNTSRHSLEKEILTRLYPGPRGVTDLVEEVAYLRKVSIQGVYKALRVLKREEVISVHAHTASLSVVWIGNEREKLLFAEEAYRSSSYLEDVRNGKKKRVQFTFRTLNEIDLFWTHAYLLLSEHIGNDSYSYSIQPHDWYMYVRYDTDSFWIKKHIESKRISRIVLTHAGALDRCVTQKRKEVLGSLFEYTLNENPLKQNSVTYYNLIGPYIFTARFDPHVASLLNDFVATHDRLPLSATEQKEINEIVVTKGKFTLTIEHSEEKTRQMRDKVKKYFEF